jgi:hypothetical protein
MKPTDKTGHYELLVPNQHTLLHELFKDSKWQGELAAGTWSGALRQAPPEIWREGSARINGIKFKGTAALKDIALKDIIVNEGGGTRGTQPWSPGRVDEHSPRSTSTRTNAARPSVSAAARRFGLASHHKQSCGPAGPRRFNPMRRKGLRTLEPDPPARKP